MRRDQRDKLRTVARKIQIAGLALSALFGALVAWAFAIGAVRSWDFAFGGFITLLLIGMTAVLISAVGERVKPGDWRSGLNLSCKIFFSQTTIYAVAILALKALLLVIIPNAAALDLFTLAVQMTPGLYISSVLAIVLSAPLYLRWVPAPIDRR